MTNLFIVVKPEHIVPIVGMVQFDVRSLLRDDGPTFSEKCTLHYFCLGTRPLTQAETVRTLIDSGMSLDFSTSSAIAYSASAYAFALASSSDDPYAMAPGTSGISAIHRPSVSRSISKLNRTWRLLSLSGGLRLFMVTLVNVVTNKSRILLSSFSIYQYSFEQPVKPRCAIASSIPSY